MLSQTPVQESNFWRLACVGRRAPDMIDYPPAQRTRKATHHMPGIIFFCEYDMFWLFGNVNRVFFSFSFPFLLFFIVVVVVRRSRALVRTYRTTKHQLVLHLIITSRHMLIINYSIGIDRVAIHAG